MTLSKISAIGVISLNFTERVNITGYNTFVLLVRRNESNSSYDREDEIMKYRVL